MGFLCLADLLYLRFHRVRHKGKAIDMGAYDHEREEALGPWPTRKAERALDMSAGMILTEEEIARAQDRFRMGRELAILERIDFIHFWLEFVEWYDGEFPDRKQGEI